MHINVYKAVLRKNDPALLERVTSKFGIEDIKSECALAELLYPNDFSQQVRYVTNQLRALIGFTRSKKIWGYTPTFDSEDLQILEILEKDYTKMGKAAFTAAYCPSTVNPLTFGTWASKAFKCADSSYRSRNGMKGNQIRWN